MLLNVRFKNRMPSFVRYILVALVLFPPVLALARHLEKHKSVEKTNQTVCEEGYESTRPGRRHLCNYRKVLGQDREASRIIRAYKEEEEEAKGNDNGAGDKEEERTKESNDILPEFSTPIGNVTAILRRDTRLVCTVEHLGQYQVSSKFLPKKKS